MIKYTLLFVLLTLFVSCASMKSQKVNYSNDNEEYSKASFKTDFLDTNSGDIDFPQGVHFISIRNNIYFEGNGNYPMFGRWHKLQKGVKAVFDYQQMENTFYEIGFDTSDWMKDDYKCYKIIVKDGKESMEYWHGVDPNNNFAYVEKLAWDKSEFEYVDGGKYTVSFNYFSNEDMQIQIANTKGLHKSIIVNNVISDKPWCWTVKVGPGKIMVQNYYEYYQ